MPARHGAVALASRARVARRQTGSRKEPMNDTSQNDTKPETLTQALRRLKEADESMTASPAVERRLLHEVRGLRRRPPGWNPNVVAGVAAAAIVLFTLTFAWWNRSEPVPTVVAEEVTTGFFPLFYASV